MAPTTIRNYCYQMTRPCKFGQDCPHDQEPNDCEAADQNDASKCPSSVSLYPFRRGAITHYVYSDVPETAVSDRANVTKDVIDIF